MTLEKAKKIIKSECYIADLLNLDRTRMVNTALDTVIEAAEETRWIPVAERLPKNYGEYICTMSNDNVQECGFVPSGEKGLIPGWSTCEADGFKKLDYQDIIAWMPLPKPYKAEGSDEE